MSILSYRLEQTVQTAIIKTPILPIKTAAGILVGDTLIASVGTIKNIWQNDQLIYSEVHLNCAAIKLANILATRQSRVLANDIYQNDQEYGRWFIDSQLLRTRYQTAINNEEHIRADILWARYCESRGRTASAKERTERLSTI